MRLKSFDNVLIAFMGLVAFICIYMLYGARYFARSSGNEIQVASIVEQIKTVKRKRDFYQSWVDVAPGEGLSQNDEIYTHGQSSAKINFVNGPEINLFENSLLRIKSVKKGSSLSLEKGNLTAKLSPNSSKLDVVLNGKKYSFESKNANIQIEQGQTENKFLLLDGKAKLNIDQSAQELGTNQVLIQNKKTGNVKIKALPFVMKNPPHNAINYFVGKKEVNFNWNYTESGAPVPLKITIAKNSTFSDVVHEETLEQNSLTYQLENPGTYYWKLTTNDDLTGPIRAFTLKEELPLSVHLDKTVLYKGPKDSEKVFINWSKGDARNYELKIETPDKREQIIDLAKNNYDYSEAQLGVTKFSVKVKEKGRPEALWSPSASLEVLEAKSISITATTPETLEKVNYNKGPLSHLLTWNGPVSGITYTVKLTKDNDTKIFETENTAAPLMLNSAGEYSWEVQGSTASGVFSNKLSGKITLKEPLRLAQNPSEGAVIELEKPDQLVSFKWDQVENSDYQFELAGDPGFQKVLVEKEITTNNISTSLAQTGRYFWRVKIKKGDRIDYSSPISVEIRPTPPLTRPEISPTLKIKIKYLEDKRSEFNFFDFFMSRAYADEPIAIAEWDLPENSRAKNYIVEIYEDPGLKKLITRIETSTPHIVWKNATLGTFYWRVSYEDYWGRKTEFSKVSTLEASIDPDYVKPTLPKIAEKLPPPPIELINPKHREDILQEIDDDFLFSWIALPDSKSYQLTISSDLEFENTLLKTKINDHELKIYCKDLDNKEGDYYWKITTQTGSTSKRRMFHASCLPKKIEEPADLPITITDEKRTTHFARVGFFPHHLSYQNKASAYSAKVSGNALNSWYGMYQTPVNLKYFQHVNAGLYLSRGKVFNSFTFTDLEANFKFFKEQTAFSWGPVVAFMKKTLYVESNLAVTPSSQTTPLLGVFIQKNFERSSLNVEAKFGGALDIHADVLIDIKKNLALGPFFDSTSLTKEGSKHSFSRFGLNLSYTFSLLETAR